MDVRGEEAQDGVHRHVAREKSVARLGRDRDALAEDGQATDVYTI